MATPQQDVTPEFAVAFRDLMLDGIIRELPITKKVLAAGSRRQERLPS